MRLATPVLAACLALSALAYPSSAAPLSVPDAEVAPDFGLTPQHDANCIEVYNATTTSGFLFGYPAGATAMDDAHATLAGNAALCAFTLRGRNLGGIAQSIFVSFRAGDAADGLPGGITAGPFEVSFPGVLGNQVVHFEAPSGYVTPNAWIEFYWPNSNIYLAGITGATVGSTHDVVYDPGQGIFDDYGGNFAGLYAVVFTSPPVPVDDRTWGALKAIYR